MKILRGICNNNSGNFDKGLLWQGLIDNFVELCFCMFKDFVWGICVLVVILIIYYDKCCVKDGISIDIICEVIECWVLLNENNIDVYINEVFKVVGVIVDMIIDLYDYDIF